MKTNVRRLLVLLGAAALLAGCQTADNSGAGGMGNANQPQFGQGPNGSQSPQNPFGVGTGTGLTQ
jgi:hypothetical protein